MTSSVSSLEGEVVAEEVTNTSNSTLEVREEVNDSVMVVSSNSKQNLSLKIQMSLS